MRLSQTQSDFKESILKHLELLGHEGFGVTELRVFKPKPLVAYVDSAYIAIRLAQEMVGYAHGVYIGVQPRPLRLLKGLGIEELKFFLLITP